MNKRIDVIPDGKTGFKVLVDFIQRGVIYHSVDLANEEAKKVHDEIPTARLNLMK